MVIGTLERSKIDRISASRQCHSSLDIYKWDMSSNLYFRQFLILHTYIDLCMLAAAAAVAIAKLLCCLWYAKSRAILSAAAITAPIPDDDEVPSGVPARARARVCVCVLWFLFVPSQFISYSYSIPLFSRHGIPCNTITFFVLLHSALPSRVRGARLLTKTI